MTASSHRIFNLSAAIALSFHWWVWLLFLLAASLPDQLEPATRERSRFRSHRGLFHTYSVWILLGVTIFWLPAAALTVSGIPVFNTGVKVLVWIYLAGVLCHLLADTASRQGCSILLPCYCGKLGYCRCPWYTRRLSLKWYRTGEFSEAVCLFLFCCVCAAITAWRWKNHWDLPLPLNLKG
jgi:LexA-binding, inner membrane-associated putative hydrolase